MKIKNIKKNLLALGLISMFFCSQSQTTIIDPATDGGFESGATFALNGWNVVNGGTNQWVCNTGATVGFSGVRCAYITNNTAGTPPPHTYNITTAGAVHLYRDVTFLIGETNISLSYSIRMTGETSWDRLLIYISNAAPGGAPTSGTPASNGTALAGYTLLSTEAQAGSWTNRSLTITAAQAGNTAATTTRRILFVWQNDASVGSNPPVAIDNISLTSNIPPTIVNMTNGSLTTCNAAFYDNGGSGGSYTNNQNLTYTFCPATAGQCIQASFTSWGMEANFDYLSVYDGNSTTANMIVGSSFTGSSPGTIKATTANSTGCLTFKFYSDGATTSSGWAANITCTPTCGTPPSSQVPQDCYGAYVICSGANFNYASSGPGVYNDANLGLGNLGCLNNYANTPNGSAEHQSVWGVFSPSSSGTIGMTIDPAGSSTTDYDWAIWGPYTSITCPPTGNPIRCSAAAAANSAGAMTGMGNGASDTEEGSGGNGWVSTMNVTAGQIYVMLLDNWNATSAPLTLSWQLTNGASLNCTPLPIELITFTGIRRDKKNYLEWKTLSEINNDFFTIEKSKDGYTFTEYGTVKGAGFSTTTKTYSLFDYYPHNGITYYRLKQTDFNGEYTYSDVISIENTSNEIYVDNIHPNPTNGNINYTFYSTLAGNITIEFYDLLGKLILSEKQMVIEGNNTLSSKTEAFEKGIYSMKVTFEKTGFSAINKIIKN